MDEGFLKLGQKAHAPRGGGDELEFLGRMDLGAFGHGNVEAAQHHGGRGLQKAHRRPGQPHEQQHGRGDGHRQSLGAAQGQGLGHQFAQHHMKVGNEGKAGGDGHHVGKNLRMRQSAHPAHQDGGGQRLAQPAQG